jgi:hypothetical protein
MSRRATLRLVVAQVLVAYNLLYNHNKRRRMSANNKRRRARRGHRRGR